MHIFIFIFNMTLLISAHFSFYLLLSYAHNTIDLIKNIPLLHMPKLDDISDICEGKEIVTIDDHRYMKKEYRDYLEEYIFTAHDYFKLKERINLLQNDGTIGNFYTVIIEHLLAILWTVIIMTDFFPDVHILAFFLIGFAVAIFFTWASITIYKHFCPGLMQFDYNQNYLQKEAERTYDNLDENYYKISKQNFVNFKFIKEHYNFLKSVERTVFHRYIFRHIIMYFGFALHVLLFYLFEKL